MTRALLTGLGGLVLAAVALLVLHRYVLGRFWSYLAASLLFATWSATTTSAAGGLFTWAAAAVFFGLACGARAR
jgi:hypothetical protein